MAKKDLFSFIKNIYNFRSKVGFSINQKNHWLILMVIFFIIFVGIILFSLNFYLQIDKGDIFLSDSCSKSEISLGEIERGELAKIIGVFNERSINLEKFQQEDINIIDPSL
ncbi:hypothetical protein ACFLY7_01090 [Patescibacteria group bacterium]